MKYLYIVFLLLFLTSCFWSNNEVEKAKQDIFSWDRDTISIDNDIKKDDNNLVDDTINIQDPIDTTTKEDIKQNYYKKNYLTQEEYITINDFTNILSIKDELLFNWNVLNSDIDKIIVSFTNETSSFPESIHTLQQFKKWDSTFIYRAFNRYSVLDYWLNNYTIDAYIWDELVTKLHIEVYLSDKTISDNNQDIDFETKIIWTAEDNVFVSLPVWDLYWNPIMLWEWAFTYSNISNFEVQKYSDEIFYLNCDNINDYLAWKYSWYYWNTCRPISWDWFYVNVLTLSWDRYIYERQYFDKKYMLFGKVLLEEWDWVSWDMLWQKNTELRNNIYPVTDIVDSLFTKIINN